MEHYTWYAYRLIHLVRQLIGNIKHIFIQLCTFQSITGRSCSSIAGSCTKSLFFLPIISVPHGDDITKLSFNKSHIQTVNKASTNYSKDPGSEKWRFAFLGRGTVSHESRACHFESARIYTFLHARDAENTRERISHSHPGLSLVTSQTKSWNLCLCVGCNIAAVTVKAYF